MVELNFEKDYIEKGYKLIAGIDEVGRGPLFGSVTCACVIMPLDDRIQGINDSKKLSEKKREELFDKIIEKAISYSVCEVDEKVIDEINILNATKRCMLNCVESIDIKPDFILIDAVKLPLEIENESIIKGDAKSYNIACASILAKVVRDRQMIEYDKIYPQFNLKKNKGYGTKEHIEAIKKFGACEKHRKSFIKNFVGEK